MATWRAISTSTPASIRWRCSSAAASRTLSRACARLAQRWGYDEINLNCGCPSERVQRGAFGACLMAEPQLVADCVKAMRDAVDLPVTVKHRIGIDRDEDYGFLRDFVGTVADAGCEVFIVHARNAWLQGLSPKENREMPPLRYDFVHRLKRELPQLTIVLNGGIADDAAHRRAAAACGRRDGGPAGLSRPWSMARWTAPFSAAGGHADARGSGSALARLPRAHRHCGRAVAACDAPCARPVERRAGRTHLGQRWSDHRLQHEPPRRVAALAAEALRAVATA